MFKELMYDTAKDVINGEKNKRNGNNEYKKCQLVDVDTRYGIANGTPKFILHYLIVDTGEYIEDIICITENSKSIAVQKICNAYNGFTGESLVPEDFLSSKNLVDRFKKIIGKESFVREYRYKSYTNYEHLNNENNQEDQANYNFWNDDEENSLSSNIEISPTNVEQSNLAEVLEAGK